MRLAVHDHLVLGLFALPDIHVADFFAADAAIDYGDRMVGKCCLSSTASWFG